MNKQRERQMQINDGLRDICNPLSRKLVNYVPVRTNVSKAHFLKVCEYCYDYLLEFPDAAFIVDVPTMSGHRPDILLLYPDKKKAVEIVRTEKPESIKSKIDNYPVEDLEVVEV